MRCGIMKLTVHRARSPQAEHRFSILASPQKNGIACKVAMREPQLDNLYIESLRCLGISDWEMRFIQMHMTSLHAHHRIHSLTQSLGSGHPYRSARSRSVLVRPSPMVNCSGWRAVTWYPRLFQSVFLAWRW